MLGFQWGLTEPAGGVNAEPAWTLASGENVMIAIIDTGRTYHPDLDLKTFPGIDMIGDRANSRDGNGRDVDPFDQGDWNKASQCGENASERPFTWHGTHVAGIAAALTNNGDGITGVAYGSALQHVRAMAAEVAPPRTSPTASSGPAAVPRWRDQQPDPCARAESEHRRAVLLQCDLPDRDRRRTLARFGGHRRGRQRQRAGNDGDASELRGRGDAVRQQRAGGRASCSNYGVGIDATAPGGDGATSCNDSILSTVNLSVLDPFPPPGGASYDMKDGTSMAAPFVAGIAELMMQTEPTLSPRQIETLLRNTTRPFPTFCSSGGGCGTGIVDAEAAVRAASGEAITHYPVSVALYGNGQGTVSSAPAGINCGVAGSACATRFASGGSLTLTATPASGHIFGGWGDACSGTTPTCTMSGSRGHDVYAAFELPIPQLQNGVTVNNLATSGDTPLRFTLAVPGGSGQLRVEISGGTGDADLYLRRGTGHQHLRLSPLPAREQRAMHDPEPGGRHLAHHAARRSGFRRCHAARNRCHSHAAYLLRRTRMQACE